MFRGDSTNQNILIFNALCFPFWAQSPCIIQLWWNTLAILAYQRDDLRLQILSYVSRMADHIIMNLVQSQIKCQPNSTVLAHALQQIQNYSKSQFWLCSQKMFWPSPTEERIFITKPCHSMDPLEDQNSFVTCFVDVCSTKCFLHQFNIFFLFICGIWAQ